MEKEIDKKTVKTESTATKIITCLDKIQLGTQLNLSVSGCQASLQKKKLSLRGAKDFSPLSINLADILESSVNNVGAVALNFPGCGMWLYTLGRGVINHLTRMSEPC